MSLYISKRLEAIASLVDEGSIVADIGADHGSLTIGLIKSGKCKKVFAVENKKGPYSRLKQNVSSAGVLDNVELSLSDGIECLPQCCDTLVLAGMGGLLIKNIIENHKNKLVNIKTIIINPHREDRLIYQYLASMGYKMEDSVFLKEKNIYYCVSKWIQNDKEVIYSEEELEYGPIGIHTKDNMWKEWIANKIETNRRIMENSDIPDSLRKELVNKNQFMEELIK